MIVLMLVGLLLVLLLSSRWRPDSSYPSYDPCYSRCRACYDRGVAVRVLVVVEMGVAAGIVDS